MCVCVCILHGLEMYIILSTWPYTKFSLSYLLLFI